MDNKKIKDKLIKIQKNEKEPFLFPILKQLFIKKGFEEVIINHGNREFGKDLVFYDYDKKLNKKRWFSVVVKNKNAVQHDFENGGEILKQIETSFKVPYSNEKNEKFYINAVIVIVNGSVTPNAEIIISNNLEPHFLTNVEIWNYQKLANEIEQHIKNEFLSNNNGVSGDKQITINVFKKNQIARLSDMKNSKELFQGLVLKEIDDIYVNVKTTYNKFKNKKMNYAYGKDDRAKLSKEEIDEAKNILNSNNNFIIHGIATSGKSLLLKRIGIKALNDQNKNIASFFIELRKYNKNVKNFNINDIIKSQYKELTNNEIFSVENFDKVILLFDGLDEIKSDNEKIYVLKRIWYFLCNFSVEQRTIDKLKQEDIPDFILRDLGQIKDHIFSETAFIEKIRNLIGESATKKFGELIIEYSKMTENKDLKKKYQIIISSRSVELIDEKHLLTNFEKIELLPFDLGQAFKLVKKIIPSNKEKVKNFIKAVKQNQLSNSLTRTPMALTLTAILYRDGEIDLSELPANITELYNKYIDYYLNRWDTSRGISLQYKYEEAKNILAFIARELHIKGIQEIAEDELILFLKNLSEEYPYEDLKDINKFIKELKNRVGLVQFNEKEKIFKFFHLSFQEYFTSIYYIDGTEKELYDNYLSEWWENTIVFYCGKQPKRDIFIKNVTKNTIPTDIEQSVRYLNLTSKCIQAAHLIPKTTQKEIIYNMIFHFEKMYQKLMADNKGIVRLYTRLELIMILRDYFYNLFNTKHIYSEIMLDIAVDILDNNKYNYSIITLYSLSYFMSYKTKEHMFLEEFIKQVNLDPVWTRIVYTDIKILKLNNKIDKELYEKIKKIQRRKQRQIEFLFRQPAINLAKK